MNRSFMVRGGRQPAPEVRVKADSPEASVRLKADTTKNEVDEALARAVVYRTLSLGFQAPTPERLNAVGAGDGFPIVVSALRHLEHKGNGVDLSAGDQTRRRARLQPDQSRLETSFGQAAAILASTSPLQLEPTAATFARLFGHTSRGLVCACETEYGPDNVFHQPQELADISGYYLAFGLRPVTASEARVDHIACELEFMDFLNRKRAWLFGPAGVAADDAETVDATDGAERTFLRDHLARFGRAFARRVVAEDPDGYFGALGRTLLATLEVDCERLGVEAGPVDVVVRPDADDGVPMACGSSDGLIQIQRKS